MAVPVEKLSNLERKITVSIPPEPIDEEIHHRIEKLAKTAKIPGFRPGKVPIDIIKQRFSISIEMEVVNDLMQKHMASALEEEKLFPVDYPRIQADERYQSNKPFVFTATFEVLPEITLKPFNDLIVEKTLSNVSDEDVEKTLEGMQKQHTTWNEVNRFAKENDKVWIKFEGSIDGVVFEGGSHDNMPVIVGTRSMIPGFEEGLLGAEVGKDLTIEVTFPENYGAKHLAGKPAKFAIHINKIEEPQLPPLDNDFAKKFGLNPYQTSSQNESNPEETITIEKLREEVKKTLQKQVSRALRQKLKTEVMNKLYEFYKDLDVPHILVKQEALQLLEQTKKQFAQFNSKNIPQFTAEMFEDRAKERVVLGLVIREIIKRDNLKPEAAKVRELIEGFAEQFDEPEKTIHYYYSDEKRLREMESLALEEQIVDNILNNATIVEKQATSTEVLGGQARE